MNKKQKRQLLREKIRHINIKSFDARPIINSYRGMSFSSRDTARAADLYDMMVKDRDCAITLVLAGSTSAGGCMQVYHDLVKHNMVDAVVATGASIVDMDFLEALGYSHYKGRVNVDDKMLRRNYIDRIYDTFIDEEELQHCDKTVGKIADYLEPRPYSSREFIWEMGKWASKHAKKHSSLVEIAYKKKVPIFCPAFTDSSAGFGLVMHQVRRMEKRKPYLSIDSVKDFHELTRLKMASPVSGLFMVGGGVPKNFAQDTVVCAEVLGHDVPPHKYAVQITVADVRDGACSSSTLKEASSWGKVDTVYEQMVYAEATTVVPLIASYLYHKGDWKKRKPRNYARMLGRSWPY